MMANEEAVEWIEYSSPNSKVKSLDMITRKNVDDIKSNYQLSEDEAISYIKMLKGAL